MGLTSPVIRQADAGRRYPKGKALMKYNVITVIMIILGVLLASCQSKVATKKIRARRIELNMVDHLKADCIKAILAERSGSSLEATDLVLTGAWVSDGHTPSRYLLKFKKVGSERDTELKVEGTILKGRKFDGFEVKLYGNKEVKSVRETFTTSFNLQELDGAGITIGPTPVSP